MPIWHASVKNTFVWGNCFADKLRKCPFGSTEILYSPGEHTESLNVFSCVSRSRRVPRGPVQMTAKLAVPAIHLSVRHRRFCARLSGSHGSHLVGRLLSQSGEHLISAMASQVLISMCPNSTRRHRCCPIDNSLVVTVLLLAVLSITSQRR